MRPTAPLAQTARPTEVAGSARPRDLAGAPVAARGDLLYEHILGLILAGAFAPDGRLPSETSLAGQFAVSRPVVRQALARLRDEEFIQSRRGSGSYVRGPSSQSEAPFSPISCVADIERCFEFRSTIESRAAELAAERRIPAALAALHAAHAHLDAVLATGALGNEADFRFHIAVAEGAGNRYFAEMLQMLRPQVDLCMRMLPRLMQRRSPGRIARVQSEHRAILQAIEAGQPQAAGRAMAAHIAQARHRIFHGDGEVTS